MADRCRVFHGVARHHDSEYRGAHHRGGVARCSTQHEIGARKLHAEPRRLHSDQRMDGRSFRNAAGIRLGDRNFHAGIVSLRDLEQYSFVGCVPNFAGLRRIDDGARRAAHCRAHVRKIGTDARDELCRDSGVDRSDAWADRRRTDRGIFPLARHFLSSIFRSASSA